MDNSASGGVGGQSALPPSPPLPLLFLGQKLETTIGRTSIASDLLIAHPEWTVRGGSGS